MSASPANLVSSLPTDDENFSQYEVRAQDIDGYELTQDNENLLKTFESSWRKFLKDNPHLRPRGKRASRLAVLQKKLQDTIASQAKADYELQRQLDFFLESREALEETYANEVDYAESLQCVIRERLEKQLDRIAFSDHLMHQTVPWEYFLETVDMKAIPFISSAKGETRGGKPSARAMALIDPNGDADDVRLRALRMDHAIYSTEIKMLEKESERIDLTNESHAFVGKFLTEHNIWGILNKQQEKQAAKGPVDP
jgi:hypothetical protein